ncbi:MAG TPA: gfo/Idh/MocA family oxidoreductase [Armatimonadetes bacterium]|nr:gfo/Idh/MocA family oxidoreductase [Armatimonadota bacterium]
MSAPNRRDFLRTSGAAAALGGLTILGAPARSTAQANTVRTAVIGFNSRGQDLVRRCLEMEDVVITALCDVDSRVLERTVAAVTEKQGTAPTAYTDLRRVMDDPQVDAVFTATPNHWHALIGIWACQAGKDSYIEKPACWGVEEGETLVAAVEKYGRVCQIGHNTTRPNGTARRAVGRVWNGDLGTAYLSRGLCFKPRGSIGIKPDDNVPDWLDWDLWQGPAKRRPFSTRYVHYNWHWFFDYGNGDIGNQGVHQMDQARWFLGRDLPTIVSSSGGRYGYVDDGETPNTQFATFSYPDGIEIQFEVRGLPTHDEAGVKIGNLVFGTKGYMSSGDSYRLRGPDGEEVPFVDGTELPHVGGAGNDQFQNFIDIVRSRQVDQLNCNAAEGVKSAQLCALANIAYLCGRTLNFDPKSMTFPGDAEANSYLARQESAPGFEVPAPNKV